MLKNISQIENDVKYFRDIIGFSNEKIIGSLNTVLEDKDDYILMYFPNKLGISGAVFNKKDLNHEYKCIYINSNEPIGRRNFTLAHEIYHIYFEKSINGICKYEDFKVDYVEKNAEQFASNLLIPRDNLVYHLINLQYKNTSFIDIGDILKLQKIFKVSFQAILMAIDSLIKNPRYIEFWECIPQIPRQYKKYYQENYWEELSDVSTEHIDKTGLNTSISEYIMPSNLRSILLSNYNKKLIEENEIKDLLNFFEEYDLLKKIGD